MSEHRVVIVGAGMGGLVSALQLARQGLAVTVVESGHGPGGKVHQRWVQGRGIDSGPTVFTMRWIFDRIFESVGTTLEAELQISPLPILARHFWEDGSRLDLYADRQRSVEAVRAFAGPAEADRFAGFCDMARRVYTALEGPFIRSSAPTLLGMPGRLGTSGLSVLAELGPMRNLWDRLGMHFRDPRLRQLFARYATYCGSSPWLAPATLMLIADVELQGVWSVQGGMHALARCLERLALRQGVVFHYGSDCTQIDIERRKVTGVRLANGDRLPADSVVFNGDVAALRAGLLGPSAQAAAPREPGTRSLSAITWSVVAPTSGVALDRHNVFFQKDYASEFQDIFTHQRLPRQPTVYLCAQDRGVGWTAPGQAERMLCLVNAPATGDGIHLSKQEIQTCEQASLSLMSRCGLNLRLQPGNHVRTDPREFHLRFPATGGALYGQATHGWMSAFARSGANTPIRGLFLAGGSVHPGPGVPMAAMSGVQAAAALMASPALTRRSRPVATSGGMSMR